MSNWSSGYNVEMGYTYSAFQELSPQWLNFVALLNGVAVPPDNWRYLELGCGQGNGLLLLAALSPEHEFIGIDFNPQHIAHARELAQRAGLKNVRFEEADFVALAAQWPAAWGQFDYVVAHGIYTWVSADVRAALVRLLNHACTPSALVYLGYNTLPGWVAGIPIQHLLRFFQRSDASPSATALSNGVQRLMALKAADAAVFTTLPSMTNRLDRMKDQNPSYLVQEYLHDNWQPMWFDEVERELAAAKLSYVGTAFLNDTHLVHRLPPASREVLNTAKSATEREVLIDVIANQSFRRDVFARGKRVLFPGQHQAQLLALSFSLIRDPAKDNYEFQTTAGKISGKAVNFDPIVAALQQGPCNLAKVLQAVQPQMDMNTLLRSMTLLVGGNYVVLHSPATQASVVQTLNAVLAQAVSDGAPYRQLAVAHTGGLSIADDVDMIIWTLLTKHKGATLEVIAAELVRVLASLKRALDTGVEKPRADQMRDKALQQIQKFNDDILPVWRALGIAPPASQPMKGKGGKP